MMVAVNRSASIHPVLTMTQLFCLNLISYSHLDLLYRFTRSDLRVARFDSPGWISGWGGLPYLNTALANVFCQVEAEHDYGTHTVFFGRVKDVAINDRLTEDSADPLIWMNGAPARLHLRINHEYSTNAINR